MDWINGAVVGDCSSIALNGQLIPDRISTWNRKLLYLSYCLDYAKVLPSDKGD